MSEMPPSLHATLGALQLGILGGTVLFGFMCLQAFLYYISKDGQEDKLWLRTLVFSVCFLDVVHTGLLWQYLYYGTVNNFGNQEFLGRAYWSLATAVPIGMVISVLTQSFFAYRGYILSRAKIMAIIIWILSFSRFAFSIVVGVLFQKYTFLDTLIDQFRWLLILIMTISVLSVILNTGYLSYTLWRLRSEFKQTRVTLNTLIVWTAETGLFSTLLYIVTLVCLITMPKNDIWLGILQFSVKIYTNSLLATLNCRSSLRAKAGSGPAVHITMNQSNPPSEFEMPPHTSAQIRVDVVSETVGDDDELTKRRQVQPDDSDSDTKYKTEFQLGFPPHAL